MPYEYLPPSATFDYSVFRRWKREDKAYDLPVVRIIDLGGKAGEEMYVHRLHPSDVRVTGAKNSPKSPEIDHDSMVRRMVIRFFQESRDVSDSATAVALLRALARIARGENITSGRIDAAYVYLKDRHVSACRVFGRLTNTPDFAWRLPRVTGPVFDGSDGDDLSIAEDYFEEDDRLRKITIKGVSNRRPYTTTRLALVPDVPATETGTVWIEDFAAALTSGRHNGSLSPGSMNYLARTAPLMLRRRREMIADLTGEKVSISIP